MDFSQLLDEARLGRKTDDQDAQEQPAWPSELPVLPLRNTVVFPMTVVPLMAARPSSIQLIDEAATGDRLVALVALEDGEVEDPDPSDLYRVGTLATIHRLVRSPDGGQVRVIVQGLRRIRLTEIVETEPYMRAKVDAAPEDVGDDLEVEALARTVRDLFGRLVELAAYISEEVVGNALEGDDPLQLSYLVATSTRMDMAVRQEILEQDDVADKLRRLTNVLTREVDVLELGQKIRSDAQSGIEDVQREYFLREQLKAIKRELGEGDERAAEVERLRDEISSAGMAEEAEREALRELERLANLPTAAAEYSVIRNYLDWLIALPWQATTEDHLDIVRAREVLDEDHYDLARVKDRIIEYLAVRKLRQERGKELEEKEWNDPVRREREGALLCFVGPPGVGKTSLGRSIARALGREFVRQSLGGVHDEAEIRGHRRTYVGAMPGRIIQAIRRVGSRNPVFMLDEVDKLGRDFRGDPASALLEVLDPEQNAEFRDHYLDVPFDLSRVMFITTANVLDTIPAPLRDRMEILHLSGYTEEDKVAIARGYLIPRQIRTNGLRADEIRFEDEALRTIIRSHTREAGVRELERKIGAVCRKVATGVAEGGFQPVVIESERVTDYLGKPSFFYEVATRTEIPGVATGLAWTESGGDILFVEATKMKGKQKFLVTGQLGDVMQESAQAALSYVRSKAEEIGFDERILEETDIHLHVPAGAIPKDGPSAGVTMATALASLLTEKPVNSELGMTGEITLRGQVLPVGGIKEKVLAAHRAGLKRICLPSRNEKDLDEIPRDVRDEVQFVLVDRVEQVFRVAFENSEGHINSEQQRLERAKAGSP